MIVLIERCRLHVFKGADCNYRRMTVARLEGADCTCKNVTVACLEGGWLYLHKDDGCTRWRGLIVLVEWGRLHALKGDDCTFGSVTVARLKGLMRGDGCMSLRGPIALLEFDGCTSRRWLIADLGLDGLLWQLQRSLTTVNFCYNGQHSLLTQLLRTDYHRWWGIVASIAEVSYSGWRGVIVQMQQRLRGNVSSWS